MTLPLVGAGVWLILRALLCYRYHRTGFSKHGRHAGVYLREDVAGPSGLRAHLGLSRLEAVG